MASWVLAHPPWHSFARIHVRWDTLVKAGRTGRHLLNAASLSFHIDLDEETPSMRAIKAYQYPTSPPDASLFEDITDDYTTASVAVKEGGPAKFEVPPGSPPCTLLERLVEAGKYEDAGRVHAELMEMGVEIRPHPVYHFIARDVLSTFGLDPQKRLKSFMKWWSLLPSKAELDCSRSVGFILTEVLRKDHTPDIPLISSFALLAASKGYGIRVALEVIRPIARYSPPDFTKGFLEDLCVTTWNHETNQKLDRNRLAHSLVQFHFGTWYSAAASSLVHAGNHRHALQLLKLARSRKLTLRVAQEIFKRLVSSLRAIGDRKGVRVVTYLWKEQTIADGAKDPFLPAKSPCHESPLYLPLSRKSGELAKSMRSIKYALHRGLPISATRLAEVFPIFLASDRKSALRRLRGLAYRSGRSAISTWVLAEMTYYAHPSRNHLQALLHVFGYHFHHVGVPTEIFRPVHRSEHHYDLAKVEAPLLALQQTGPVPTIRRRLAPSKEHIHLLWRSVVAHAQRPAAVARLYRTFVEAVAMSCHVHQNAYPLPPLRPPLRPAIAPNGEESTIEYLRPIPPRALYDRRIFHDFIDKFFSFGFITSASRVALDMFQLGFVPDAETRNKFTNGLQFKSGSEAVDRRLEYWEKTIGRALTRPRDLPGHPALTVEANRQRMYMFFYLATVQRLRLDGRLEDATHVAKRFMELVPTGPTLLEGFDGAPLPRCDIIVRSSQGPLIARN